MAYRHLKFPDNSIFLITGGAGFIGSNLCEALLEMGYSVRVLDNLSTGFQSNVDLFRNYPCFTFIQGDIRDLLTCQNACEGVDFVLHNAAWGSVPRSIKQPLLYEDINIKGTLNMMEAARQAHVKKFVYASSSSVYGEDPNQPKREGCEGLVLSPYALTKKVDEEYGRLYKNLYELDTYGLRYFNVFGKRQNPNGAYAAVIPKFILQILKDERPIINGDGQQSRDFTYIENVIEANLKSCHASSDVAGQAFNIGYGDRTALIEVLEAIQSTLGKSIEPIFGPDRRGDVRHSQADINKARTQLNYQPAWNLKSGIAETIAWYQAQEGKVN